MNKTKTLLLLLTSVFLSSITSYAQLAMNLKLNAQNYIRYEKIYVRLTIKNQSGQAIVFGSNEKLQGKITFQVDTLRGNAPKRIQNPQYEIKDILLKAGDKTSISIPLTKYFEFSTAGKYQVKAVVTHSQLQQAYETEPVEFNILTGNVAWTTSVGVPLDEDGSIDKRTYSIISYFDGTNKIYCLLVDDPTHIYGLTKIGFDIGTNKPECEIDNLSRLHMLIQNSSSVFSYFVYDIHCRLEDKEVYKRTDDYTIPHLFKDEKNGRIQVIGGILAVEGRDYMEKQNSTSPDNSGK
ncbi:MAG TPA: hypothetical protein DD381_02605 [Lentisphaeria bacterium]|nr:MAG: hypothetical protein A2X47_03650 [Lentisphaerae bacterium GWF2_38_69]HBM15226.1 hypothetical protein [Lentisphaeria bacterium]